MDELNSTVGIVALAAGGVALVSLLLCATMAMRLRRVRRDQRVVLGERAHRPGRARGRPRAERSTPCIGRSRPRSARSTSASPHAEYRLDGAVSKTAVIRYDAFTEGSGRQSSSVALLDDRDTGVVFSAILQREQARVYAKPVVGGSSPLDLSPEELEAMERARRGDSPSPRGERARTHAGRLPRARRHLLRGGAARSPPGTRLTSAIRAPTIHEAIMAVEEGDAERAFVPFENSIEGSVRPTLDALAFDTERRPASSASSTTRSARR